MLIDELETCGELVNDCDVFNRLCLNGILMAPIHCRGSIGELVM